MGNYVRKHVAGAFSKSKLTAGSGKKTMVGAAVYMALVLVSAPGDCSILRSPLLPRAAVAAGGAAAGVETRVELDFENVLLLLFMAYFQVSLSSSSSLF